MVIKISTLINVSDMIRAAVKEIPPITPFILPETE